MNDKALFHLEPSAYYVFIYIYLSAFIKCQLCVWHLLDTENLAMSLQMQTGAQASGSLHAAGRGDQIIPRIIIAYGEPRGAPASLVLEGEERLWPLLGKESLIPGFTVKPSSFSR